MGPENSSSATPSMPRSCHILVMASGNGSNFQALIDAVAAGQIPNSKITRLMVNRKSAYAMQRAEENGIPRWNFNMISHDFQAKNENDPEEGGPMRFTYDRALATKILHEEVKPHLIVLAGWTRVLSENFLNPIQAAGMRVIKLHPALPGSYTGFNAIEQAFDDFQVGNLKNNKTGITVHHGIKQADEGDVIMTKEIRYDEGEDLDLEKFRDIIQSSGHELIVEATARVVREILGC